MKISRGRTEPCKVGLGGIQSVLLFKYDPINAQQRVGKRGVSLTSYPETLVYEYEVQDGQFNENFNEGLGGWSQSLSFSLIKQTVEDAFELDRLARLEIGVIVLENNGTYRLIGAENGCFIDNNTANSGGGKSDFNGYKLSVTGNERYKSPQITDFENSGFVLLGNNNYLLSELFEILTDENNNRLIYA